MVSHEREVAEFRQWFLQRTEETERRLSALEDDLGRRLGSRPPAAPFPGRRVGERALRTAAAAALTLSLAAFAAGYLLARYW